VRRRIVPLLALAAHLAACLLFLRLDAWQRSALRQARRSGEITLITRNTPECYTLYRDAPTGFEYDLARRFADSLGLRLRVVTAETWPQMLSLLERTPAAFIAAHLAATPLRREQADFSAPYRRGRHVLITAQRRLPLDLAREAAGLTIHLPEGSSALERLEELRSGGLPLTLLPLPEVAEEELIRLAAEGEISATAAMEDAALISRHYYPRAAIAGAIGTEAEAVGWAVRRGERALLQAIDRFLAGALRDGGVAQLEQRYFAAMRELNAEDIHAYHRRVAARLPEIQSLVSRIAAAHGFDWRLISALIYQESHFIPDARGPGGSQGLMQLMPAVAAEAGVTDPLDPAQNVRAGVRHLRRLFDAFDGVPQSDRLLMALAAYNLGRSHILDAMQLARERGLDANRWSSLVEVLPLLERQRVYARTRSGFCRGGAAVAYINRVLIYYDILRQRERREDLAALSPVRRRG
jgi:membrane-bound lytic murein transglycosylase F